eukprot:scaffold20.g7808.t1
MRTLPTRQPSLRLAACLRCSDEETRLAKHSSDEETRLAATALVEWLEQRAAAAAAELLAEEERRTAQQAAKATAKAAKRQRQKERRRRPAAAPEAAVAQPQQSSTLRSGSTHAAEQQVLLTPDAEVPEPAAAEESADSLADAELAQLMLDMGVSQAAAGAWGSAGAGAAADTSPLASVAEPAPASPVAQRQQQAGGMGVAGGTSAAGASINSTEAAAARDALICELLCPITHEPMHDPVLAADGRTYERPAIEAWIAKQRAEGQAPTSPLTGQPLEDLRLVPNHIFRGIVASAAALGLLQ